MRSWIPVALLFCLPVACILAIAPGVTAGTHAGPVAPPAAGPAESTVVYAAYLPVLSNAPTLRPTRTPTRTPTPTRTASPTRTPTRTPGATATATSTATPTATATNTPGPAPACAPGRLPADNIWNHPVDSLPLDANSAAYVTSIGATAGLKADFGAGLWDGGPIGIPFLIVSGAQSRVPVTFDYAGESDPGPYPVPTNAPIEGGPNSTGDRHVLVLETGACELYELYDAWPQADGSWQAGSGAIYDQASNALRPAGWTSADAAGLPILPGLVRYDEVAAGAINHAIRFTVPSTRRAYIWPARHYASSNTGLALPPMGQRFRLKAGFDMSGFSPANRVILQALKTYGMILADNGSAWYMSGAPDERWNNDDLRLLQSRVHGSDFEAVDESGLMIDPSSGQARR